MAGSTTGWKENEMAFAHAPRLVITANKKLLVLDIDETLIYASASSLPRHEHFRLGLAYAWLRPGAHKFITTCQQHYGIGIWSSATREYVADVFGHLRFQFDTLAFIWTRERCVSGANTLTGEPCRLKQFRLLLDLGYPAAAITIVDDEPGCWFDCTGRLIAIPKFKGDPAGRELYLLSEQLMSEWRTEDQSRPGLTTESNQTE